MPIENIFRCADEMDFAPQPTIEADFFSGGFDIPCEEQVSSSETEKPINPIKDWKFTINRAFMRGLTADDILNAIGDEIKILENAEEILNYIKKYEGLIGTVFVDSSVLESGFPISAIPKKFTPYHRFAINCKNPKIIQNRSISGKSGGGIDDFLNSADRINVKTTEIDRILGLPILKNGMLTRNVIKEIDSALEGLTADKIEAAFAKSKMLLPAWKDFDASLTSDKKFSTASAAEFFSPQNLTRGLNMSFWQAYGGIFTGLGILGTFGGLVYGLYGVDMSGGDIDVLKSGIAKLLSGVETAFVTSLVGIGCAIFYSVAHHLLMKSFRERLAQLADRLDKIFPRRTAEDWLAKSLTEQQLHTAALNKLGDTMDKFSSDSVEAIGEVFRKRVGSQMDNFSAALDRFTKTIDYSF